MGNKSIKKNYLYNLIYQILILTLPIITTPYISRTLGAEQVGIYSFIMSVVTYFSLFGTLGNSLYGQREIAYAKDNKEKRKKVFIEIITFRFITMFIAMVIFFIMFAANSQYDRYYQILLIYLLATACDISWFFQGMEEFKRTVTRSVIVRVVSVACIFIFVKTQQNLWKYILIYALADLLGNLSLWLYLPKYLKGQEVKNISLKRHIIPIALLFIPQIAIKIYNIIDKTMIGYIITNKSELGNYEEAYKVINVLFTIVTSLGVVMVPRMASIFASGDKVKLNEHMMKSFRFTFFLAFPITFGIIAIAKEFVPTFLGGGYELAVPIIYALAPIILLCGITNVIGTQYLLPTKRQKEYTISILAGLVVNVVLNIFFIQKLGAVGAAITTIISQITVVIVQILYVKKQVNVRYGLKTGINYFFASTVMFLVCFIPGIFINSNVTAIIVKIVLGGISYLGILVLLRDNYVYEVKNIVKKVLSGKKIS